ncbi:hypothetical protein ACJX0J_018911, partial [Zea mays]
NEIPLKSMEMRLLNVNKIILCLDHRILLDKMILRYILCTYNIFYLNIKIPIKMYGGWLNDLMILYLKRIYEHMFIFILQASLKETFNQHGHICALRAYILL